MVGCSGVFIVVLYGFISSLLCVNDIVVGIVIMMLGVGLVFYLGKLLI